AGAPTKIIANIPNTSMIRWRIIALPLATVAPLSFTVTKRQQHTDRLALKLPMSARTVESVGPSFLIVLVLELCFSGSRSALTIVGESACTSVRGFRK